MRCRNRSWCWQRKIRWSITARIRCPNRSSIVFCCACAWDIPSRASEKEILRESRGQPAAAGRAAIDSMQPAMEAADVLRMQQETEKVRVDESLLDYALEIAESTRHNEQFSLGVSTRGALMLHRAAQARAYFHGRDYTLPDDFKQLAIPVFAHRLVVNTRFVSTQKKTDAAGNQCFAKSWNQFASRSKYL